MKYKDKKMLFGIGIVFLFLATVGFSYAYFTATLVNKDVKNQVVETGTLQLTYTDGPEIIMNNIKPGATITKEISVKNTGTLNTAYNLVWQELANEIINDEMVIEATCTRLNANGVEEGTCENLTSTPIKRIKINENISIESSVTHKYNITITFKEISADQNYNQGKNFTGTLGINEYVENSPIYCTFDGDMVQGAEYVNGQYTYRYKQEGSYSNDSTLKWMIMSTDGWGVQLTDRDDVTPVTSALCTYINDKPVVSMSYMFLYSKATSIDINKINTSNVINMEYMFANSSATTIYGLDKLDTSKVTNMRYMLSGSKPVVLDVSNFNTSSVTNMNSMLRETQIKNIDLSNFDTSNVKDMSYLFYASKITTLNVSSFDTSNVTDMTWMFGETNVLNLDLSGFDTSNVTDMYCMFNGSKVITIDLSNFNTENVTGMNNMFGDSNVEILDLSSFDTSNVNDMAGMFFHCYNLKTIYVSDKFVTDKVTSHSGMFLGTSLVGGNGTKWSYDHSDKTYARIDGGPDNPGYFTLKTN